MTSVDSSNINGFNPSNLGLNNTNTHYIKREITMQNNIAAISQQNQAAEQHIEPELGEQKRQTYGLAILELMSDQEYQAWLRATAGMTETEKMLAVQKLYPLADIERLKSSKAQNIEASKPQVDSDSFVINANRLNGMRVFNADSNFVQRYKNALDNINENLTSNVSVSG